MKIMCIDPATEDLGIAVFEDKPWKLVWSACLHGRGNDWLERMDYLVGCVAEEIVRHRPRLLVIEDMEVRLSAAGQGAVNSGSLGKLIGCVHSLRTTGVALGCRVHLVPVSRWKGQVPKEVTQRRVRTHWGWQGEDHNEADAVGIGDWYLRKSGLTLHMG